MDCLEQLRSCKLIATVIVASMILIDFTLLTAIVPVIPTYLWEIHLRSNPDLYKSNNNLSISAMNLTSTLQASNSQNLKEAEKLYLATQSVKIAAIIAAKPAVQVIANFFVGPLVDRIGYRVPMTAAALIICTTAVVFGLGQTYPVLFVSAAIQGIGSACNITGGMSLLARTYTAKNERGKMIGLCLGMIGIGTAAGPPYGSVMNAFAGKAATFLTLAGIIALLGIFQLLYTGLKIEQNNEGKGPTAIWDLLKDVYILIALGAMVIVGLLFGGINGTFTSWLIGRFNPLKWQLGLAYLPFSAAYGLTANLINFVPLMSWRGLVPVLGFVVSCVGLISLPFSSSFFATFGSTLVLGFGSGLTDGIIFPDMATLVDIRHTSGYGSIYALADIAINVGLIAGPFLASGIVRVLSFPWAMWILAIICFVYTPCLIAPWYMMKQHQHPAEETELLLNGSRRPSNQPTSNNN